MEFVPEGDFLVQLLIYFGFVVPPKPKIRFEKRKLPTGTVSIYLIIYDDDWKLISAHTMPEFFLRMKGSSKLRDGRIRLSPLLASTRILMVYSTEVVVQAECGVETETVNGLTIPQFIRMLENWIPPPLALNEKVHINMCEK